jgi:AraC-like DNA-binding protein
VRYAVYLPSPRFASVVETYWILEGPGEGVAGPVFPDGRVELIFHYGAAFYRQHPTELVERQPGAIVAGQMLAPVTLFHHGHPGVAAIRLRPAAASSILRTPATELTGHLADLRDVVGPVEAVRERLSIASDDRARIAVLEQWLADRGLRTPSRAIDAAVDAIAAAGVSVDLTRVAFQSGLGLRQLERRFLNDVGLPPKSFARIVRLQRALRRIRRGDSLSDVASACGYYDQSHMARDFRSLADSSPSAWRTHGGALAPLFVG